MLKSLFKNKSKEDFKELNDYLFEKIQQLEAINEGLNQKIIKLNKLNNSESLLYEFIKRRPKYFDVDLLSEGDQLKYYNESKNLLDNKVLQNEISALVNDFMEEIALRSDNFETVRALRMSINALQLITERLEDIQMPNKEEI